MKEYLPYIIGVLLGVPIGAYMELNWLGIVMLSFGLTAACFYAGG